MALSLNDVKSRQVKVMVSSPDGYELEVTIGTLSYMEWNNCAIGIEFPSIPTPRMLTDKGMQDVFNHNDPTYRSEVEAVNMQIAFRRVVASLIKGGNFPELKTKSLDEQVDALQDMDTSIVEGVMQALSQLKRHTKGGIEAKKAGFQSEPISENHQEHPESEAAYT